MKTKLLNITLDLFDSEKDVLDSLKKDMDKSGTIELFFVNAHCFNVAQKNKKYFDILNSCNYLLNDGIGIKIASLIEGLKIKKNLNGTDFIPELANWASQNDYSIYLLGGSEGVAQKAAQKLKEKYKNLKIVGFHNGYDIDENVIEEINSCCVDILIAGMGVPKQEIWIRENSSKMPGVKLFVGGGAILDFLSERIKRAPMIFRKFGFEWLYRLMLEPARLWRRYVIGNFLFFYYVFILKCGFKTAGME